MIDPIEQFDLNKIFTIGHIGNHEIAYVDGVITFTWVYSGLLSMEPFGWFETEGVTRAQRATFWMHWWR